MSPTDISTDLRDIADDIQRQATRLENEFPQYDVSELRDHLNKLEEELRETATEIEPFEQ